MKFLSVEAVPAKRCAKCCQEKPLTDFHRQPSGAHGRFSYCKLCANAYYRGNRKRNYSAEQKQRWQVKTRYGITVEDVKAMRVEQDDKCGICEVPFTPNRLHCIDHDHSTGIVRGLLCHRCNVLIGGLDDAAFLAKVLMWLERGQ